MNSGGIEQQKPACEARVGRRGLLTLGAKGLLGGATGTLACSARSEGDSTPGTKPTPADVGRKFNADGTVMPFAGNTFVGRIPQQGPRFALFDALLDVYREVPTRGFASKLTMLPPSSYHVTLFGGVNDADRNTPNWGVPFAHDTPVDKINALYLDRLRHVARAPGRSFEFVCNTPPAAASDGTLHVPCVRRTTGRRRA